MSPVRLTCIAVTALVLSLAVSAEAARVRREGAQLRAATGFSGAVLVSPARGDQLEVLESSNEWRRVRTAGGVEGWIHERLRDEAGTVRPAPARLVRPSAAPGTLPKAEPFEAPEVDERVEAAPAAELERLRQELARERAAHGEAIRELDRTRAREADLSAQVLGLQRELSDRVEAVAAGDRRLREMRVELADAVARQRRESEDARSHEVVAAEARHAAELAALQAAHEAALAAAEQGHQDELADARNSNSAEIAELQQQLLADQERIGQTFVEKCSALHEREMDRKQAEWAALCDQREGVLRAAHVKELRKVGKESGWEEEFEREVRTAVKEQVEERLEEARLRWEARHRGDAVELDKELAKQRDQLEADCESRVLAAVNAELERHRAETNESLRALQAEEERRCKAALALVLERNVPGAPPPGSAPAESRP